MMEQRCPFCHKALSSMLLVSQHAGMCDKNPAIVENRTLRKLYEATCEKLVQATRQPTRKESPHA
jgi:hypothetical protein